jgi:hypothetical protein
LFDRFGAGGHLTKTRVVDAPNVTHLRYRVEPSQPDRLRIGRAG